MKRALARGVTYAAAVAVLLAFLAPIGWVVDISLKTRAQIFAWPPAILGFAPTLANYRDLFAPATAFPRALLDSLVAALGSAALSLLVGLPAAYALARRRLRRAGPAGAALLLFRLIPPVALLLPDYLLFRSVGLLGSLLAVVLVHFTFSLAVVVWMMRDSFENLPAEVEEAATVDGATPRQVFLSVALPMTRATVAASAIFALLTSWNEFLFAVTLTRLQTQTLPVTISTFVGDVYTSWGQLAAATVLGLLPALGLTFLGQRWLLSGMAPGSVK